MSNNH
jgi:hypothetical protein